MTDAKIHIKVGVLEISFEGSETFIKDDLLRTLEKVKEMFNIKEVSQAPLKEVATSTGAQETGVHLQNSVAEIAAKLNSKTCPELVMAAAARLTLVERHEEFSRKLLLDTMRNAKGRFKSTFVNNLRNAIEGLVKNGKLNPVREDTYSLTDDAAEELRSRLVP